MLNWSSFSQCHASSVQGLKSSVPHLARPVDIICDAVLFQRRHSPVIRPLSNVICTCAAAIDLFDTSLVWRLVGKALEDSLGHCRPANVAEAYEEDGDGLTFGGHGRGV